MTSKKPLKAEQNCSDQSKAYKLWRPVKVLHTASRPIRSLQNLTTNQNLATITTSNQKPFKTVTALWNTKTLVEKKENRIYRMLRRYGKLYWVRYIFFSRPPTLTLTPKCHPTIFSQMFLSRIYQLRQYLLTYFIAKIIDAICIMELFVLSKSRLIKSYMIFEQKGDTPPTDFLPY